MTQRFVQARFESLEHRQLLSASPVSLNGHNLRIRGTSDADVVKLTLSADGSMLQVYFGDTLQKEVEFARVKRVRGDLRGGDDVFTVDETLGAITRRMDIQGKAGNDTFIGGSGKNRFQGGKGDDHLSGGSNDDKLQGGQGNDVLIGNDGNDKLLGNAGNDDLDGGLGIDLLDGGDGIDSLNGGDGLDQVKKDLDDILTGTDDPSEIVFSDDNDPTEVEND